VYAEYDTEVDYDGWTADADSMESKVKIMLQNMEDKIIEQN
jgi:hypothetical protein